MPVKHFGCSVADVDIMMGTFTKSFGAAGGYIAAGGAPFMHWKHLLIVLLLTVALVVGYQTKP